MCTVHSFPHNIDHCLTFARSEFEGLLEKAPQEANAFLSDPAQYLAAVRTVGCHPVLSLRIKVCPVTALLQDSVLAMCCKPF